MKLAVHRSADAFKYLRTFLMVTLLPGFGIGLLYFSMTGAGAQAATQQPTAAQPPQPQTAAPQPGVLTIGQFVIIGNKTLNADTIIAFSGFKVGDPCNEKTLDQIATNLAKTGYFGYHSSSPDEYVRVRAEENNPSNGKCKVIIEVDENDTLTKVSVSGSGPIKPEDVLKVVSIKPRTDAPVVYNANTFINDVTAIQNLYRNQGYIASLTGKSGPENGTLVIDILVARVSEIKITGNRRTNKKVILREMQTKEGDYYNVFKLNKDRQRLYNLDLFEDALPQERDVGPGRIALTISVVEKRTGTVSVGVGYSNRQQLVGRAEIEDTNFRGMGETVGLVWETGGVAGRNTVELNFTKPWLDRRNTTLSASIYDKTVYRFAANLFNTVASSSLAGSDTHYFEQRTGGTIALSRPVSDIMRAAINFRAENVRTDDLDLDAANASIIQNGPVYALGGSLTRNTRDLDLDPISGGFQRLDVSVGHANLNAVHLSDGTLVNAPFSTANFGKGSIDLRQYFSLQGPRPKNKLDAKKRSVALRFTMGAAAGNLPFFEQYFIGGAENLRGYREDRFWGKYMALGSIEFRQPVANALTAVLFSDVGTAWGGSFGNVTIAGYQQDHGFSPHPSIGVGIRVRTPLGPLRLDYGIGTEGGRTHFSIGNQF